MNARLISLFVTATQMRGRLLLLCLLVLVVTAWFAPIAEAGGNVRDY